MRFRGYARGQTDRTDRQTHRHTDTHTQTCSSQYSSKAPAGEVITSIHVYVAQTRFLFVGKCNLTYICYVFAVAFLKVWISARMSLIALTLHAQLMISHCQSVIVIYCTRFFATLVLRRNCTSILYCVWRIATLWVMSLLTLSCADPFEYGSINNGLSVTSGSCN